MTYRAIRVVVADDDATFRSGVATLVEQYGNCNVVGCATNGREAIELCEAQKPDLLLLDAQMPKCDGPTAAREIIRRLPDLRIVGLSSDPDAKDRMLEAGADAHLRKSEISANLCQTIHSVLSVGTDDS